MGEIRGISVPTSQINFQPDVITDATPTQDGIQQKEDPTQSKAAPTKAENASQLKGEQNVAGTTRQTELGKKLNATSVKEFPENAGNDQLGPIGVNRQVLDGETITQFPNGVRITRSESPSIHSNDIRSGNGNPTFQKAGSNIALNVVPPPGGRVDVQKNGEILVRDSNGQQVAFMDPEGKISTKTKQGDYTQFPDGKMRFSPNGNTSPESLLKPGAISPKDFENYGITTDGKSIRFPNGVEYDRRNGVRIPSEIGRAFQSQISPTRPELTDVQGFGFDGNKLYSGERTSIRLPKIGSFDDHLDTGTYDISTHNGTFHISNEGKISFEASGK